MAPTFAIENSCPVAPIFVKEKKSDDESNQHHLKMVQHFACLASSISTSTFHPYGPNDNTRY